MKTSFGALLTTIALTLAMTLAPSLGASASESSASDWMAETWGVDDRVRTTVPVGSVVLLGGDFTGLRSPSGDEVVATRLAKFEPSSGTFLNWPVTADGTVHTIAVSGNTAYLGGSFSHVNGVKREALAAVSLSTGQLLSWSPGVNKTVESLVVVNGAVYVGGSFDSVQTAAGTSSVRNLARFTAEGALDTTWSTSIDLNNRVFSLLPTPDGQSLYVGGAFDGVAPVGWPAARHTKLSTGAKATIDPTFRAGNNNGSTRTPVHAMALSGNNLVVASAGSGGGCSLLDATTGNTRWSYRTNGDVVAAAIMGDKSYCGGHFGGTSSFAGLQRFKIAEMVTTTGAITNYAPRVDSALGIYAMSASADALFIGGDFDKVGGNEQQSFGMFRALGSITVAAAPVAVAARGGDGKVVVTWDQPNTDGGARISRYHVYRAKGSGGYSKIGSTSGLGYLDGTVTNGDPKNPDSAYHYQVRTQTSAGESAPSSTVTATPQQGAVITPSAPQQFEATGTSSGGRLSWTAPVWDGGSPVTSYIVYRGTSAGAGTPLATVSGSSRAYTDTTGQPGVGYYYRVSAVSSAGEGPSSKERSITPNTGAPGRPTLTGTVNGDGDGTILLEWEPGDEGGSPIQRYVLVRDGIRVAKTSASVLEFTDTNVVAGQTYRYKVKAVNSYGSSPSSDRVVITAS